MPSSNLQPVFVHLSSAFIRIHSFIFKPKLALVSTWPYAHVVDIAGLVSNAACGELECHPMAKTLGAASDAYRALRPVQIRLICKACHVLRTPNNNASIEMSDCRSSLARPTSCCTNLGREVLRMAVCIVSDLDARPRDTYSLK